MVVIQSESYMNDKAITTLEMYTESRTELRLDGAIRTLHPTASKQTISDVTQDLGEGS